MVHNAGMRAPILLLLAATAVPTLATTPIPAGMPPETSIPFVGSDGIQDFRADGDKGLYIRSNDGRWFYAKTMGACPRLTGAISIGFATVGGDQLDRFGAVVAQGWRCPLASVVVSTAPPPRGGGTAR